MSIDLFKSIPRSRKVYKNTKVPMNQIHLEKLPTSPDVISVAVTGSFVNWSLSQKTELHKAAESTRFETTVHVDRKQKLVFKFVVNGSTWSTYESYKTEFDEHGNENNYVDAEELIDENELSNNPHFEVGPSIVSSLISEPESIKSIPQEIVSTEAADESTHVIKPHDHVLNFNKTRDLNVQPILISNEQDTSESYDSENDIEAFSPLVRTSPLSAFSSGTTPSSSGFREQCKDSIVGTKEEDVKDFDDFCSQSLLVANPTSADYEPLVENCSLAESSFTEVSFVTSSSQYALQEFENVSEQCNGLCSRQNSPKIEECIKASVNVDVNTKVAESSNLNTLDTEFESPQYSIYASHYASDDEIDSLDEAPHFVDSSNAETQPGVFAKIRGLFRF